jgi:hypothetical protein
MALSITELAIPINAAIIAPSFRVGLGYEVSGILKELRAGRPGGMASSVAGQTLRSLRAAVTLRTQQTVSGY